MQILTTLNPETLNYQSRTSQDFVRSCGPIKWLLIISVIYATCFLYGLDTTITGAMQAPIVKDFNSISKLGWVGIGFPLGSIVTILPLGKAFGVFDCKVLYVGSVVLFEVGSALCGGAKGMNSLIVGRVFAGSGGAGLYLGCLNLVSNNTSIRERPVYISSMAISWGVGCVTGPLIGGAFADSSATWRWAFYINLVLFALCAPVYFLVLEPHNPQPDKTVFSKLQNLDWIGAVLNGGLFVSFVILFTFAGPIWPWSSGHVVTLFIVIGALLLAFLFQQCFTDIQKRIFPGEFLRSRDLVLQFVAMSSGAAASYLPIYYIPLYFTLARGDSTMQSAVRLLPYIVTLVAFEMIQGVAMPKVGYYRPFFLAAGILQLLSGSLIYSLVRPETSNVLVYGLSVLSGIGAGIAQQAAYSVVQAKVSPAQIPDAVNFINFAQIGGMVYVLTIASAIFQNTGSRRLHTVLQGQAVKFTEQNIQAALAGAKSDVFSSVAPAVREKLIAVIVDGIGDVYVLMIVAGGVSLVAAVLMKGEKMGIVNMVVE